MPLYLGQTHVIAAKSLRKACDKATRLMPQGHVIAYTHSPRPGEFHIVTRRPA